MTEHEYYDELRQLGFEPTGNTTNLIEEWAQRGGLTVYVTKPQELSPQDRAEAIDRLKRLLGINFPPGARVH